MLARDKWACSALRAGAGLVAAALLPVRASPALRDALLHGVRLGRAAALGRPAAGGAAGGSGGSGFYQRDTDTATVRVGAANAPNGAAVPVETEAADAGFGYRRWKGEEGPEAEEADLSQMPGTASAEPRVYEAGAPDSGGDAERRKTAAARRTRRQRASVQRHRRALTTRFRSALQLTDD